MSKKTRCDQCEEIQECTLTTDPWYSEGLSSDNRHSWWCDTCYEASVRDV